MTSFPRAPKLLKSGLVVIDPDTSKIERVIVLQYNPASLSRSLKARRIAATGQDREQAMRLTGPPIETYQFEAEIDAADELERPEKNAETLRRGILSRLAAIEALAYPTADQLRESRQLADSGKLEIAPMEQPLVLWVWGRSRVLPVHVTSFSVTEEAFDLDLNPIRAKVRLDLRVLNEFDVGFSHRAGPLFDAYHRSLETLARGNPGDISSLGISGVL